MAVELDKNDDIWTVVLHRPEVRNAADQPTSNSYKLLWSNETGGAGKSSPIRRIMKLAFLIFSMSDFN